MYEKVNPMHPDKIADRIAGALVDMAYRKQSDPKIAVEVLIGHGTCHIIAETSEKLNLQSVIGTVRRIAKDDSIYVQYDEHSQDGNLARNQNVEIRCGDNGIFKGVPVTDEQRKLARIANLIYEAVPQDGKYVLANDELVICQSNVNGDDLCAEVVDKHPELFNMFFVVNPIGSWTGGLNVDTGATNRKLGSDMGDSVTGGGLCGKDLSKADVSVNIYAWLKAQITGKPVELYCAIGDTEVDGRQYSEIVRIARSYIELIGGFEKFAEWGLIR